MAVNVSGGALEFEASINMGDFERDLLRMERGLNRLAETQKKQAQGVEDFAKRAQQAAAGFLSVTAAYGFVKQMVAVRGEFQQINMAFTTMLKSKDAADRLMAQAVKLAAITPFTLKDVASGAKQLLAYGFAADDVTKELTKLGNIAAGVGSQLNDVVYLYGTLKASGRVTQVDINQFAGRGIPIYEELAKVLKINVDQVREYVSAGKIGFKEVEQAFANLTGPAGKFFNLMEAQSQSLTGKLSNLEDAWDRMLNSFGEANEGILNGAIDGLINLVDNYEKVIEIIQLLIITYGAYRAALIINNTLVATATSLEAGWTIAQLRTFQVMRLKEAALIRINALMKSGAITIAAYTAVLAALGAVAYSFIQYQDGAELAETAITEAREKGIRVMDREAGKIDDLLKTIRDQTKTKREQKDAYDALLLATGDALTKYSQEEIAAGKAAGAIEAYKDEIKKASETQSEFAAYQKFQDDLDLITEKGYDAISMMDKLKLSISRTFGGGESRSFSQWFDELFSSDAANKGVLNQKVKEVQEAQKKILEANPGVQKKLDEQAAERNKDAVKAAETKKKLSAEEIAAAKKYNALLEDRKTLEREINSQLAEARAKGQSEEQSRIVAINKSYDDLLIKVDKLNSKLKPKDQLSKAGIENARMLELGVAGVDAIINGPGGYKEELDKKQKLFTQYEQAKVELGAEYANKAYKAQLGEFETYYDYIKNEIESRKGDKSLLATKKNEVVAPIFLDQKAETRKKYEELLAEFMSYNDQRKLLTERYNADIKTLENSPEAKSARTQAYTDDLGALDDANVKRLDAYKALFEGIADLSDESAEKVVANAQQMLDSLQKEGKISVELAKEIQKTITATKKALKEKLPDRLITLANQLDAVAASVQGLDDDFAAVLSTVANVVGQVGNIGKGIEAINKPGASGLDKLSAGLGILGAGISIFKSVFSLFDRSKDREEQAAYAQDLQAKKADAMNKALERQIALLNDAYGTDRIVKYNEAIEQAIENEKKYAEQLTGKLQLTGNKDLDKFITKLNNGEKLGFGFGDLEKEIRSKVPGLPQDIESLQRLMDEGKLDAATSVIVQNLIKANQAATDLKNNLDANNIGVSLDQLANDFISSLTDGTQDFGKTFEDTIRTSLINGFKGRLIEQQLQKFYTMFADLASDKEGLSKDDISKLREFYLAASEKAKQDIKDLEAATGIKLTDDPADPNSNSTGMAGRIENITHEDADKLAGLFNGFRLTQMSTNDILRAGMLAQQTMSSSTLEQLILIANHTLRTANNTDKLSAINDNLGAINDKMDKNTDALAGTGRGPI